MFLSKCLELTTLQVKYDSYIRIEGILGGEELKLHRGRMEELARQIQKLRTEVDNLLRK